MSAPLPYVAGPPGGVAEVTEVAELAASTWGLPTPRLLRMGMNGLFTAGDAVIRVGRVTGTPESAIALASRLRQAGVRNLEPRPVDPVSHGGLTATAWERLAIVDAEPDWREVGRMVAIVHSLDPGVVPDGYPLPPGESFPWWDFDALLADVGPDLDAAARAGLESAIAQYDGWAPALVRERVVCHGDVHPGNVAMTVDGPVLLDWDLLCSAPPGWDHAMLLRLPTWGWPDRWYCAFADGYGRSLADDPAAVAIAELRLVAATLMRVRAARTDPAAAEEAARRLQHWRGDPDAPTWRAQ